MEGPSIDDDEKKGIIPRMVNVIFDAVIFDAVMDADDDIEFSIRVSVRRTSWSRVVAVQLYQRTTR